MKRQGRVFQGLYADVYKHMAKRGFSHAQICAYVDARPFKVLCRAASMIVRRKIIAKHNYCELRGGKVYVGALPSSLVALG